MKLILKLAWRYLTSGRNDKFITLTAWFSLLGIVIGVCALIVVMSVMSGFRRELTNNLVGLNGELTISSTSKHIERIEDTTNLLSKLEFVEKTRILATGQSLASSRSAGQGALIKAMDQKDIGQILSAQGHKVSGDISHLTEQGEIAIGAELAWNLGAGLGDYITLTSLGKVESIFGNIPRSKKFRIGAVFSTSMHNYDSSVVIVPLQIGKKLLMLAGPNEIEVYVTERMRASEFAREISELLQEKGIWNLRSISWAQSNAAFLDALKIERVAMFTILSLIIIVAAFNIISSLFMLVRSRARDIALLRTIGLSKAQVGGVFIVCGCTLGIVGTAIGTFLGAVISLNIENVRVFLEKFTGYKVFDAAIYFLYNLPSSLDLYGMVSVVILSLLMSMIATIYPALRAASLDPVEVLRYE